MMNSNTSRRLSADETSNTISFTGPAVRTENQLFSFKKKENDSPALLSKDAKRATFFFFKRRKSGNPALRPFASGAHGTTRHTNTVCSGSDYYLLHVSREENDLAMAAVISGHWGLRTNTIPQRDGPCAFCSNIPLACFSTCCSENNSAAVTAAQQSSFHH
jgi:hypothetical protein